MIIIGGSSHPGLTERVAERLGWELIKANTKKFADQELKVQIDKDLYEQDVVIVQSTSRPANDHLMELLLLADTAKRAGCRRITAVIPYFGYGRQDRPSYTYGPISASLVGRLIETSGVDRIIALDMHTKQSEGFFRIGVKNLEPTDLFIPELKSRDNYVVVSPDVGGLPRAKIYAAKLGTDLAIINKSRSSSGECTMSDIIGNIAGKSCIIVDDIIDTGDTLCKAAHLLINSGASSVSACITHAVFSDDCIEKIEQAELEAFYTTDTIDHPQLPSHIKVIATHKLISGALSIAP